MNPNITAHILSFVLIFIVIAVSTILQKMHLLSDEGARKMVHIGVSNWWFLVIYLFDNMYYAMIPPIIFIILNYLSYKMNLIKSMERGGKGNLGTVYFPISLLILVIASFTITTPLIGGLGIFVLGYGDGLAAVFGKAFGKKRFSNQKSICGSLTMFVVSVMVVSMLLVFYTNIPFYNIMMMALILGVVATIIEFITPFGLDNLTIPLLISLCSYVLIGVLS